jgi:hypothetical protein
MSPLSPLAKIERQCGELDGVEKSTASVNLKADFGQSPRQPAVCTKRATTPNRMFWVDYGW